MSDSLAVLPYDLPDAELLRPTESGGGVRVFVPERVLVVIGKGSDPALELHEDTIVEDNVPVLRRGTGGCAVVLSPRMLCASFAVYGAEQQRSADYFREFNGMIIRALTDGGVTDLEGAGTSDIARQGRKLVGSALYRNRVLVFYHAVINLADGTDLMERYLKQPPRTPDYREGRSHGEFVSSLAAEGFEVDAAAMKATLETEFAMFIMKVQTT
jgi:lipoate-protein ligase A